LIRTPYLVLFIFLGAIAVGTASALITITLSGDVIITGFLDMTGDKITDVASPTTSTDAATKGYVDSAPGTDTLALLGCTTDQVARWDGIEWECSPTIDCDKEAVASLVLSNVSTPNSCSPVITTLDNVENGAVMSVAVGSDGFPVISYWDLNNVNNLNFIHCTSIDCSTFDTPIALDDDGGEGQMSSIAIGTDGFPVISYTDSALSSSLKIIHCTSIDCSSTDTPTLLDSGSLGFDISMKIGTDGFPAISYHELAVSSIKFVHCTNIACSTFDTPLTLDSGSNNGNHTTLAIGSDGFPIMAYLDFGNTSLKIVHCTSIDCSIFDTPLTLDNDGSVGRQPSITIGLDGNPVIVYEDKTSEELKLIRCAVPDCSSLAVITGGLVKIGNVSSGSSITIGADGKIIFSYNEEIDEAVKVVHCEDFFCNERTVGLVDDLGQAASWTSIAITSDQLPVIVYKDESTGELKFAHCGDKRCIFD